MPGIPSDIKARDYPAKYGGQRPLGQGSPPPSEAQRLPVAGQTVLPPSYFPPPEAQFFLQRGRSAALNAAAGAVRLALFRIPQNTVGWIREWSVALNNMLVSTDISFTILVNGGPVPGYTDFRPFASSLARFGAFFPPEDTLVQLSDGAQVEIQVQVFDAGTYDVGTDYRGWFISKAVAGRYPHL